MEILWLKDALLWPMQINKEFARLQSGFEEIKSVEIGGKMRAVLDLASLPLIGLGAFLVYSQLPLIPRPGTPFWYLALYGGTCLGKLAWLGIDNFLGVHVQANE